MGKQISRQSKKDKKNILEDEPDADPLEGYKSHIEYNRDQINNIKKDSVKMQFDFIQIDHTKLFDSFINIGHQNMDLIFVSIGKEIRSDFNYLWKYFEEKAERLKTPSTTLGHLKANKQLMDETRAELPNLEKLIKPM